MIFLYFGEIAFPDLAKVVLVCEFHPFMRGHLSLLAPEESVGHIVNKLRHEKAFANACHVRMRLQDLFNQRSAGSGHSDDKYRRHSRKTARRMAFHQVGRDKAFLRHHGICQAIGIVVQA